MRLYGLSGSGLDVDSLVKDLMKAANTPLNKLNQQKTTLQWKKEDYSSIYNTVSDFRNKAFDFRLDKNLSPQKVTSSNESAVTASTSGGAAAVTHTVEVDALATGAASISSGTITAVGNSKTTIASQFSLAADTTMSFQVNGKSVSINTNQSLNEFASALNRAGAGVQATYDSTADRMYIYSSTTGSAAKVDFTGSADLSFITDTLKLSTSSTGTDASVKIDGQSINQSSYSFTLAGVSYTLKNKTAGTPATISVSTDTDKTVENIKSFIESYNATLKAINDKVNEKHNRSYAPLSDQQKSSMSDSEITAWEKIAKTGLLSNDSILRQAANNMRHSISNPVAGLSGQYTSLASIGITTGAYTEGGKLYLDETKLRKALQEDPTVVKNLFGTDGATSSQDGISQRLYDSLKGTMTQLNDKAGVAAGSSDTKSSLAKEMKSLDSRIDTTNSRISAMQERYYKQFDALETMMQRLNSQSSWISQLFGGSSQ